LGSTLAPRIYSHPPREGQHHITPATSPITPPSPTHLKKPTSSIVTTFHIPHSTPCLPSFQKVSFSLARVRAPTSAPAQLLQALTKACCCLEYKNSARAGLFRGDRSSKTAFVAPIKQALTRCSHLGAALVQQRPREELRLPHHCRRRCPRSRPEARSQGGFAQLQGPLHIEEGHIRHRHRLLRRDRPQGVQDQPQRTRRFIGAAQEGAQGGVLAAPA
jgi:hypothetical protein